MKHLNLTPSQFCDATKACKNGRKFALTQQTMVDVWDNCSRPEWLLWILDAIDASKDDKQLRLFAVWCARNTPMPDGRTTGALLSDPRSIAALEVAERYAHGMETAAELAAARASAWAAAGAAARASAWAAAGAAAGASAGASARAAAGDAAWAAQADQLRKMIANPFSQGGRK